MGEKRDFSHLRLTVSLDLSVERGLETSNSLSRSRDRTNMVYVGEEQDVPQSFFSSKKTIEVRSPGYQE